MVLARRGNEQKNSKKRIQELEEKRVEERELEGKRNSRKSPNNWQRNQQLLHKFESNENINLYLVSFERQASRIAIPKELWVSHLVGLLALEITHIMARESEEQANV
ncbi:hypothetical protein AVEN_88401-1 [Araneus ventricosus]|uniref:Uncharacterized protein n=1 Tax=Araneus ventricosus TaxID=182803 RepID=A0A4Y2D143_ARAVE|nr:hypothetical protein AVEN_19273-1 [Araneus ventricosus]GBM09265.1 hypothetical protein AVEN_88401-1 [Araneus ventricosus]